MSHSVSTVEAYDYEASHVHTHPVTTTCTRVPKGPCIISMSPIPYVPKNRVSKPGTGEGVTARTVPSIAAMGSKEESKDEKCILVEVKLLCS